jgi:prepilin-type N-terminal cleavage/methylation domain-containing protein
LEQLKLHGLWRSERGFTLVEVMATIIILMIVLAIASSTWFGAVESRRVDSATTQLAADLRQAHSRAINRLADQTVTLTAGNSEYTIAGGGTADLDDNYDTTPAGDVVSVAAASTIVFRGDGSAQVTGANPITVRATSNPGNNHTIVINTATSGIKVVP